MRDIAILTLPNIEKHEVATINALFQEGLPILHLRKPNASRELYENIIKGVYPEFHPRIVIHDHFDLLDNYELMGIHLSTKKREDYIVDRFIDVKKFLKIGSTLSTSAHSIEEILSIEKEMKRFSLKFDYIFLSPIFDSISKNGYKQAFNDQELRLEIPKIETPLFALGGIDSNNISKVFDVGFSGAALMGYIWQDSPIERFNTINRPIALSIAGFDPSSGAGITADIKTFESIGVYGIGVCSALTVQNATEFKEVTWLSFEDISKEIDIVNRPFGQLASPEYIKIGIIRDLYLLDKICEHLIKINPNIKIIWDPIISTSSGYIIHEDLSILKKILRQVYLITPNGDELEILFGNRESVHIAELCKSLKTNILWKGGHNVEERLSTDRLFLYDKVADSVTTKSFSVVRGRYGKHGSGCVLSSAITAFLAKGYSLSEACNRAQIYVSKLLDSNCSKIGFHPFYIEKREGCNKRGKIELIFIQYITDPSDTVSITEQIEAVCKGGIKMVQLRMKESPIEEVLSQAKMAKRVCDHYGALLIINDNPIIARQIDADGVHLGKSDMDPDEAAEILGRHKIIGVTCNTTEDIIISSRKSIDYIGLGPFRGTNTKKNLSPLLGYEGYKRILSEVKNHGINIPIFSIGGITENDIIPLQKTGISRFALSSTIKNSPDIEKQTIKLLSLTNLNL